ncbi:MAG: hypothetical protein AAGN35_06015 [Bacteroidota bacterium]
MGLGCAAVAQNGGSLQRITLSSVTLSIDSVDTPEQMTEIRNLVQAYPQVQDFDIKYGNCDFTLDDSEQALQNILVDLGRAGYNAEIYRVNANQTFTYVPEESCVPGNRQKADMSEQEVIEKGITRGTPPPKNGR